MEESRGEIAERADRAACQVIGGEWLGREEGTMAQVTGGTTHDYVWDRKLGSALRVVRDAADLWAAEGADALEVDSLLAVVFHIFSDRWVTSALPGQIKVEVRGFAEWRPLVSSALAEAQQLSPRTAKEVVELVVEGMANELHSIVPEWSEGNPESPPTEHVLNSIVHALFENRLVKRPANPRLPTLFRPHEG